MNARLKIYSCWNKKALLQINNDFFIKPNKSKNAFDETQKRELMTRKVYMTHSAPQRNKEMENMNPKFWEISKE